MCLPAAFRSLPVPTVPSIPGAPSAGPYGWHRFPPAHHPDLWNELNNPSYKADMFIVACKGVAPKTRTPFCPKLAGLCPFLHAYSEHLLEWAVILQLDPRNHCNIPTPCRTLPHGGCLLVSLG